MERIRFRRRRRKRLQVGKNRVGEWKMERYFMRQDYYTLIFDTREADGGGEGHVVEPCGRK